MDSSVSLENQIWFLRVCHHVPFLLYHRRVLRNAGKLFSNLNELTVLLEGFYLHSSRVTYIGSCIQRHCRASKHNEESICPMELVLCWSVVRQRSERNHLAVTETYYQLCRRKWTLNIRLKFVVSCVNTEKFASRTVAVVWCELFNYDFLIKYSIFVQLRF